MEEIFAYFFCSRVGFGLFKLVGVLIFGTYLYPFKLVGGLDLLFFTHVLSFGLFNLVGVGLGTS